MYWVKVSILCVALLSCSSNQGKLIKNSQDYSLKREFLNYSVDLENSSDDLFRVTLEVSKLTNADSIYNFATTIPGSYSKKDFGRLVKKIQVYDSNGEALKVERRTVNSWFIQTPQLIKKIYYEISESWDTKLDSNEIALMSGSSIEKDHVLFNTHAVIGFFNNHLDKKHKLSFNYNKNWLVGSQNIINDTKNFIYKDFYELVDSPLLFGELSYETVNVNGVKLNIFVYSKTKKHEADDFLDIVENTFKAFLKFIERKPVNEYTFLFHFEDKHYGALEHKASSVYVYEEEDFDELKNIVRDVVSHEIFHLQTPLHIRSEKIHNFDFTQTVPVKHLWFYEGVTEWASHILLLRSKVQSAGEFFQEFHKKIGRAKMSRFDQSLSLIELSEMSYSRPDEYINVYQKGAIVACLLDIHILDKTNGKKGLREIINSLATDYDLSKPFNSDTFLEEIVTRSDPSLAQFIDDYINGAKELPINRTLNKIGINYFPKMIDERKISGTGYSIWRLDEDPHFSVYNLSDKVKNSGLMEKDSILAINGNKLERDNLIERFTALKLRTKNIGLEYTLTVKRADKIFDLILNTELYTLKDVFRPMNSHRVSQKQGHLNQVWFGLEE